jgi:hypothetical protein
LMNNASAYLPLPDPYLFGEMSTWPIDHRPAPRYHVLTDDEAIAEQRGKGAYRPTARSGWAPPYRFQALSSSTLESSSTQRLTALRNPSRRTRREMKKAAWAYFDTSVLVKRYVNEQGSMQAEPCCGDIAFFLLPLLRLRLSLPCVGVGRPVISPNATSPRFSPDCGLIVLTGNW